MASRIASTAPPMKLRERELLNAIHIRFLIPPLPSIFVASATQVLTPELLKTFINNLLTKLALSGASTNIPTTSRWILEGKENNSINLSSWNARHANQDVYKVIALPSANGLGILGGELGAQTMELQGREVFEVRGSHLLIVVHFRQRIKLGKKSTTRESQKTFLIPADLKPIDLVKFTRPTGTVTGLFQSSSAFGAKNLQADLDTATELGWKHGTELWLDSS